MSILVLLRSEAGEYMDTAEVICWLGAAGDRVTEGQPLVEVETAKATFEVTAPAAGVIAAIHAEPGQDVEVGAVLAIIDPDEPA
jgi:pyruvate/2-oxoglutarate dehydrogenase complex dihydrolipoamide acyltransferase (E2) component